MAPLLLLVACASGSPYEGMTSDQLFAHAESALEEGDWSEAAEALELFSARYPVHERQADARFMLGEAFFGRGEYLSAASEFETFMVRFPGDERIPRAALGICRSYAELSPIPPRDQTYTRQARTRCEAVARDFAGTEEGERAEEIAREMTEKLAEKDYRAGEQYQRFGAHDSAIIYFEEVADRFPQTTWAPRALLAMYRSYRAIGYEEEAEEVRERLLAEFPESNEARRLEGTADGP